MTYHREASDTTVVPLAVLVGEHSDSERVLCCPLGIWQCVIALITGEVTALSGQSVCLPRCNGCV